jgi:hypothetical protein
MAKKTCQLVKITLPGADAIGIIYPDNEILVFRGKKAVRLMPLAALIKMCSLGGVSRRLSAQHPLLDEAAKALGIKPKSPCRIKMLLRAWSPTLIGMARTIRRLRSAITPRRRLLSALKSPPRRRLRSQRKSRKPSRSRKTTSNII